jgi:hypothetical protein
LWLQNDKIMAKYKLRQFATAYGIKESTVKSYVHRKQLQKDSDGYIDTEIDKNKLFILEMELKINNGTIENVESKSVKSKKVAERPTGLTASQQQYADIDLRTKLATAEARERESELKRIQLEKMAGNLLPVDLVEKIVVINIQAILKGFRTERENMTSILIERFGGNRKDLVEINAMLDKSMDIVISKAKKEANYELEQAISTYQDSRGRGEKR